MKTGISNTSQIYALINGVPVQGLIRADPYEVAPDNDIGEGEETIDGGAVFLSQPGHVVHTIRLTISPMSETWTTIFALAKVNLGVKLVIGHGQSTAAYEGVFQNLGTQGHQATREVTFKVRSVVPQVGPIGSVIEG